MSCRSIDGAGTANLRWQRRLVAALVAVNCVGNIIDPKKGQTIGWGPIPKRKRIRRRDVGDTLFAMSTGQSQTQVDVGRIGSLAAELVSQAISSRRQTRVKPVPVFTQTRNSKLRTA